jgi:acetyl-CoA carboxylase biotin carboxyl carrier protein
MDIEKVRELVRLVEASGVAELEVTQGETSIRIRKDQVPAAPAAPVFVPPAAAPAPAAPTAVPGPGTGAAAAGSGRPAGLREVLSPIVGTFYRAPAPGSPPFVDIGTRVAPGQTLCIIEAMKVMNEIEAEFGGTVREILALEGAPVEAEAPLFLIDPA